jgi:hypothetical protein
MGRDKILTPQLISYSNIQASSGAFYEIVAFTAFSVNEIKIADTTGKYIGIYVGPAGSEVLEFIVGPGMDGSADVQIPRESRMSIRSMETTAPTSGFIAMNFLE